MPASRRRWSPPAPWITLGTLAFVGAFVALGTWQWSRGLAREAQWAQYTAASGEPVAIAGHAVAGTPVFTRVSIEGHYDPLHQVLLDNRTHGGRPGYEVLTPFVANDGTVILVDRGWVEFGGYRERLPDVSMPGAAGLEHVHGRLSPLPTAGLAAGRAPPVPGPDWPKVTSYPDFTQLSAALGTPLAPQLLLLDAEAPRGYVREWRPPGLEPARHYSYAVQWWALASALVVIYVVLNLRKVDE